MSWGEKYGWVDDGVCAGCRVKATPPGVDFCSRRCQDEWEWEERQVIAANLRGHFVITRKRTSIRVVPKSEAGKIALRTLLGAMTMENLASALMAQKEVS
jgi:predicted nucleic acid-binding Zn ribbon protein